MLRRQNLTIALACASQARSKHASSQSATLAPVPGTNAGMQNMFGDVSGSGSTAEEERRRPIFRQEVAPKKKEWNSVATLHKWGCNSLTLFRRVNEDPGQWYLAGESALLSQYSMVAADVSAGMWSGIQRETYGLSEPNLRPDGYYRKTVGKKDKNNAVVVNYEESAEMRKTEPQMFLIPHTKEHAMHQRLKNPALPKFKEMQNIHFRRVLREAQYHLGIGLRHYMIDGVFGNHDATGTPYRIFTDNANHAYIASLSACRKPAYCSADEQRLLKSANGSPLEEFAWRRPGVVIYHCPGYDFTAPRIVEEFGGPRPSDLGLEHQKFITIDPYAIPMKAVLGGVLAADELLKTTAFLCSRWGFYADGKKHLTLDADAIVSKDGKTLTVIVGAASDAVRASPYLYSTRNIRIGDDVVSRCWDSVQSTNTSATRDRDMVEADTNTVYRPSTTRLGNGSEKALSHRLFGKRKSNRFAVEHSYTEDAAARAAAGGHLLGSTTSTELISRNSSFPLESTQFIILGAKGSLSADVAAQTIVSSLSQKGLLYAEEEKLVAAFTEALSKSKGFVGEDALSKVIKGE